MPPLASCFPTALLLTFTLPGLAKANCTSVITQDFGRAVRRTLDMCQGLGSTTVFATFWLCGSGLSVLGPPNCSQWN